MRPEAVSPLKPLSRIQRRQIENEREAQERQAAADERALRGQLNARVTRLELSRVITPVAAAAQQHEVLLTFIAERGLVIRDGRAYLDEQDLKDYLEEKRAGVAEAV